MHDRSSDPCVRNPALSLSGTKKLQALPPEVRLALYEALRELAADAGGRAQESWKRHKAPMAAYWKAVSVYAGHFAKAVRP